MRFLILALILPPVTCTAASPDQDADQQVIGGIDEADSLPLPMSNSRPAHGFASLGDSYSAGIGTGIDGEDLTSEGDCRRGVHAYPQLILHDLDDDNNNNNNNNNNNVSFQWLSCTGAVTTSLLSGHPDSQIDRLDASSPLDFATLSIGGNDLGFFDVMNACIFRFYGLRSGACGAALAAAEAAVRGDAFGLRLGLVLRELLDGAAWWRRPGFGVVVTGYARFFDEETPACDDVSLGVWRGGGGGGGPRLSRAVRARVNRLVLAANDRLRGAVAAAGGRFRGPRPRVLFADYDDLFAGHRFCEPGVVEPDYGRADSWFFLVGGPDNARGEETTWPNGTSGDPEGTRYQGQVAVVDPSSPLVDPGTCLSNAQGTGDWGELALCYMAMAKHEDPSLRPAYDGVVSHNGMWWVPTYYGKTFHPRTLGHEAIRDSVYRVRKEHGIQVYEDVL